MKISALWFGLLLAGVALAKPGPPSRGWQTGTRPLIRQQGEHSVLILTPAMQKVLEQSEPTFRLWRKTEFLPEALQNYSYNPRQCPSAVIGDFNGDKTPDVALHGRTSKDCLLAVLLSKGQKHRLITVRRTPYSDEVMDAGLTNGKPVRGLQTVLSEHPAGKLQLIDETLTLPFSSFQMELYAKGGFVYYWLKDRFVEVWAGC